MRGFTGGAGCISGGSGRMGETVSGSCTIESITKFQAAVAAGSPTGFWRMSSHPAVQQALATPISTRLVSPVSPRRKCLTRSNRRGTDPYARWCDRDSPRGPTYVDQRYGSRGRHDHPTIIPDAIAASRASDGYLASWRRKCAKCDWR